MESRKCAKCGFSTKDATMETFHRFPKPLPHKFERAKKWAQWCYPEREWDFDSVLGLYKQHKMLCSRHFKKGHIFTSGFIVKTALPTIVRIDQKAQTMLEVCVDSVSSAVAAAAGGADHIELCSSLSEGGLTPTAGLLHVVKQKVANANIKINVMIRCRAGADFCYSDSEMQTMLSDVEILKNMGVDGFVFGALTHARKVDETNCAKIIEKASPIPVTFHRAFDVCNEPFSCLEDIISLGFDKILTSGLMESACRPTAVKTIRELTVKANDRIIIMAGAGVTEHNVQMLADTGVKYFHSSCKVPMILPMKNAPAMGTDVEKIIYETDVDKVRKLKEALCNM